jgi:hypothetical protein
MAPGRHGLSREWLPGRAALSLSLSEPRVWPTRTARRAWDLPMDRARNRSRRRPTRRPGSWLPPHQRLRLERAAVGLPEPEGFAGLGRADGVPNARTAGPSRRQKSALARLPRMGAVLSRHHSPVEVETLSYALLVFGRKLERLSLYEMCSSKLRSVGLQYKSRNSRWRGTWRPRGDLTHGEPFAFRRVNIRKLSCSPGTLGLGLHLILRDVPEFSQCHLFQRS